MVQVVKPNQLSPIQGSAGQQQVIQSTQPNPGEALTTLSNTVAKTYDTAGTVYARNKSEEIVSEELGNVETAIALAEDKRKNEDFVRPENLPVSDDEFTMIEGAVRSGAMTQNRARLIASSRLRSRIAEEPFFADKLRQAASSLIGFNIESEQARQYFASFNQGAGSGAKTQQQKWWDQAQAESVALGVPAEDIYRQIAQESYYSRDKDIAVARKEAGIASDVETFGELNSKASAMDFGSILGNMKLAFQENGSVDEQAASQIITQAKAARLAELDQIFDDPTSTEYQRAQSVIETRFQSYSDFVKSVGFDTLNTLKIERVKRANEILGNDMFRLEKFVIQNLGSDAFTQTMDIISSVTDPSRLEAIFRGSPTAGKIAALSGNETALKSFGKQLGDIYMKIARGQQIGTQTETGEGGSENSDTGMTDSEVAEGILAEMMRSGGESEDGALKYMEEQGMEIKPVSMLIQKNPNRATESSKEYFKTMFNNTMPQLTQQLGQVLAENPNLEWSIDEKGIISVTQPQPRTDIRGTRAMNEDMRRVQRQMRGYNAANELIQHINLYGEGVNKGWGKVVGTTAPELRKTLADTVDKGFVRYKQATMTEAINLVLDRDTEAARAEFDKIKQLDDRYQGYTFEQWQEAILRKNGLGG